MTRRVLSLAPADFHLEHLSGRWDRSKKMLRAQVQKARRRGATITTHTEVAAQRRASALRHRDFTLLQGKAGTWQAETAISVHTATWEVVRWEVVQIGDDFGVRGPVGATIALLRHHATGRTLLVSTMHLPASVEGAWRARGRRVVVHQASVRQLRIVHRRWRRKHNPDAEVSVGDWNLNLHRAWVRTWCNAAWPALAPLPKRLLPSKGTHGPRLIDWPVVRRLLRPRFTVNAKHPASDHRGVTLKARIPARRRSDYQLTA